MGTFRTTLLCLLVAISGLLPTAYTLLAAEPEQLPAPSKYWVYLGTYTQGTSKGIYRSQLDTATGKLDEPVLVAETQNPSFLAIHPTKPWLYAVGELYGPGGKGGAISAFAIEPTTGKLKLLGQQPSGGAGPCHVSVDHSGGNVLVANYGSGSVACLPIKPDGSLAEPTAVIQHVGSSVNPKRQQGPHAHSIYVDSANRFAFAPDLGCDKVFIYRFDAQRGKLTPNDPAHAALHPGAGPRHFAFHPNGRFAYVVNELDSTVTVFAYDAEKGALKALQTIGTLPEGFAGNNTTADIHVHPSGKFLYASNRGHDSIAIFTIEGSSGTLRRAGHQSSGGRTPRNFGLDPTGSYLLAANQASGNVVVFRIDQSSGGLKPAGAEISLGAPVCVKFMRPLQ